MITNVQSLSHLKLELAAVMDIGEHFVKSIYILEGDSPLVLICYEEIKKLRAIIQAAHYPNINAIAADLAPDNSMVQQQLILYTLSCVKDGLEYFQERFSNDSISLLNAVRAARCMSPSKIDEMQRSTLDTDSLTATPFLLAPSLVTEITGSRFISNDSVTSYTIGYNLSPVMLLLGYIAMVTHNDGRNTGQIMNTNMWDASFAG